MAGADADSGADDGGTGGFGGETVAGDTCSFTVNYSASTAIGTVESVQWSTDLPGMSQAQIDFGPTGSALPMTAPVDLSIANYRTLLLGMKGDKSYSFRIVATSEESTCTSPEFSFTTGAVPDWVPVITKSMSSVGASQGFLVTTPGFALGHSRTPRDLASVYIFDTDGDIVWWVPELVLEPSRAHISWDGKTMWLMNLANAGTGKVFKISMDGMRTTEIPGLELAHHDFAVLPDGGIATMLKSTSSAPHAFVEVKADGAIVPIVSDLSTLYEANSSFHPNSVHYYPEDDSFTLSDRFANLFVKFKRSGELVWQLGGLNPKGQSFSLVGLDQWVINHGHHMTPDGHFLFFNNDCEDTVECSESRVLELLLDETNWTATWNWEYVHGQTEFLGDAQRLPNGNVLATYSMDGEIQEVTPFGDVVQAFDNSVSFATRDVSDGYALFGYAEFRSSLYGPPPR